MAGTSDRDRFYSRPPSPHGISSMYGWAPDATTTGMPGLTGLWSPLALDSSGNLKVNIGGVTLTGDINVNNNNLEDLVFTGVRYQSGISGELASVIKTAIATGYDTNTGIQVVGRAVNTNTFLPKYVSGANAEVNVDKDNGGLLVNQGALSHTIDSVVAWQTGSDIVSNTSTFGTVPGASTVFTGTYLTTNANRVEFFAQNMSTVAPLYILFGSGIATNTNCNVVLNPATASGEAGGSYSNQGTWRGQVSVSGRGQFILWEI